MRTRRLQRHLLALLASAYCRAEDVGVVPIIVAELELGDIEMPVFFANPVESADAFALAQRPETLTKKNGKNGVRVDFIGAQPRKCTISNVARG
jgi:hypothetical protein